MSQNILEFNDGDQIIKAGILEKRMYIILEGSVAISLSDENNNSIVVANLVKGDFFGEISLFYDQPRTADVVALGTVKLVYIDNKEQLKLFLIKNSGFAAKMVYILAQRLAKTDEILIGKISELNRLKIGGQV
jgi:CRP/FNR family transcriptional regulator, cyclic AMP receptor protein